jgi:hypothetical protein
MGAAAAPAGGAVCICDVAASALIASARVDHWCAVSWGWMWSVREDADLHAGGMRILLNVHNGRWASLTRGAPFS